MYRPIKEVFTDVVAWETQYGHFSAPFEYSEMLKEPGWQIIRDVCSGDYQGQYGFLLREESSGRFGVVFISYGSCSGCDALQACQTWDDLSNLRDDVLNTITWFNTPVEAVNWFESRDWETQAAYYEKDFGQFKIDCISYLASCHFDSLRR